MGLLKMNDPIGGRATGPLPGRFSGRRSFGCFAGSEFMTQPLDKHLLDRTDQPSIFLEGNLLLQRQQGLQPAPFLLFADFIFEPGGTGIRTVGVLKCKQTVEFYRPDQIQRFLKIGLGFAGKSRNNVR